MRKRLIEVTVDCTVVNKTTRKRYKVKEIDPDNNVLRFYSVESIWWPEEWFLVVI